ncbi:hypothetical protein F3J44_00480 [Pantoea sp. Tr-811]|uniref:hypothetical protein n=1 Tax=unclassified Pantoea TaxID=2630326 RepID=UPI00141F4F07|nr:MULTISPECIES: hypothetical protein [unclassified Pantoea]NIE72870.1 hypothetical protein [Pantoea sp. Ap-967]NIF24846.1 hypothetical protein [Pantoea sp. Tr-811]
MSKSYSFQLSYTINPLTHQDEPHAEKARSHMRNKMGWDTVEHIETTLLGEVTLAPGDSETKRREARTLVRNGIRKAFKELAVDKHVAFKSSLLVSGLAPAMELNILPE